MTKVSCVAALDMRGHEFDFWGASYASEIQFWSDPFSEVCHRDIIILKVTSPKAIRKKICLPKSAPAHVYYHF